MKKFVFSVASRATGRLQIKPSGSGDANDNSVADEWHYYGSREGTIQKYFANPKKYFKSQYYSQITVEKFDKSKKLLQIVRNFVDPQITFSIIRKYFANP